MTFVAKNRGKIWKWARLLLDEKEVGPLQLVPLASEGIDRQEILVMRAGAPVLTLGSDAQHLTVTCPTGERPSWTLPVTGDELRTKDVMPRIIATLPPMPRAMQGIDAPATTAGPFSVVGRFAAKTGRNVGTRLGDYVCGRISVSSAGLARRSTGELAAVDAGDDAVLLERFYDAGVHPRVIPTTHIAGIHGGVGTNLTPRVIALADGSVVTSGEPVRRWTPEQGVRELPVSGEVIGCWTPRGGARRLMLEDGTAVSLDDQQVARVPLPHGASIIAVGDRLAWRDADNRIWRTAIDALGPTEALVHPQHLGEFRGDGHEGCYRFQLDDNGTVLVYSGYKDNGVFHFVESTEGHFMLRCWGAGITSGYGHVQRYCRHREHVVIVKTAGLVHLDLAAQRRWRLPDANHELFHHTSAAFAPSGRWLLVLGDETLYALTLGDHLLRRLIAVPGVLDVVGHPEGVLLLSADGATLLRTATLEAFVERAPVVARFVDEPVVTLNP